MRKINDKEARIVLATRVKNDKNDEVEYEKCKDILKELAKNPYISKVYIVSNIEKDPSIENGKEFITINDPKGEPTRATAFNLVLERLRIDARNDENAKYHLLTYSKEVKLKDVYINKMVREIENNNKRNRLIVVGFQFQDNVTEDNEYNQYANSDNGNAGIAYWVPWNTCALWNKEFVYGEDSDRLIYDEICENNQLGHLKVKIHDILMETRYEGVEDGLAIAKLITNKKNKNLKYTYKLFDEYLFWRLPKDDERVLKHKIKLARKNIVLSTFMNIKGYSIDKLREAAS